MDRPGSFRDHYALRTGGDDVVIDGLVARESCMSEDDTEDELTDDLRPQLYDFLDLMMANEEHAILLILQGPDCSGKSGTVKHVVQAMNPIGVRVSTFDEPTEAEGEEHYLDRIRRGLPELGRFAVFDRSHYEDVLVPMIDGDMTDAEVDERIGEITAFEDEIEQRGITIVKCFLNLSYDEQRERFLRRIRRPDKQWKFHAADLDSRAKWPESRLAYGKVIGRTSTEKHPWYSIPVDHKWHRNWVVANILVETFELFDETYPALAFDADELRERLQPPN